MTTKTVSFGGVITYPNNNNTIGKKEEKANSFRSRFNCGVLRSSLKINGSLISVRLVSSKLRKREDSTVVSNNNNTNINNNNPTVIQETEVRSASILQQQQPVEPPPFLWRYSSYSNSSQLSISTNNDQATLVHTSLPCEETSECKGFRKNLRGKWRRLVKKKSQPEVYTIPAEIRDQLKQIYVY
ncbi:hypothetical protein O3M35_008189 [Rhynocoris fuscipes]|uniref:Uncharacterized protein n=1 Tax=Rhynocoris fuscipes TaxID=488301 RepID=A0AAW1D8Z2_9HEMI